MTNELSVELRTGPSDVSPELAIDPSLVTNLESTMDTLPIFPPQVDERPDITVVVVNYNTAHLLDQMFATLEAARGALRLQVLVVDNASRDSSIEILRSKHTDAELIENRINVGFGRANNQAVPRMHGRYLLLLNTDVLVASDTLQKIVSFMDAHPRCGVLGVKLVGANGALQPSCRYFPTPWNVFHRLNRPPTVFSRVRAWWTTCHGTMHRCANATGFQAAFIWCDMK